jgi:hypothetical protein
MEPDVLLFACISAGGTLVAIGMSIYSISASKRNRAVGHAVSDQKTIDQIDRIDERTLDIKSTMDKQDDKIDGLAVKVGQIEGKLGINQEAAQATAPPSIK